MIRRQQGRHDSTWATPTVSAVDGYGALGFRYPYVGRFDVQWDDFLGAGLHYMHARHYHPEFGRFLQPDPSALSSGMPATKYPSRCRA